MLLLLHWSICTAILADSQEVMSSADIATFEVQYSSFRMNNINRKFITLFHSYETHSKWRKHIINQLIIFLCCLSCNFNMNEGYIPLSEESIPYRGNHIKENSPEYIDEYVYTFFITWYFDILPYNTFNNDKICKLIYISKL